MIFEPGHIYHIYNRGNNRQQIFFRPDNYLTFLNKIKKELLPYCEILTYCLMPNHFHIMVLVKEASVTNENPTNQNLNNGIGILLRSYTRLMQQQEHFTGSLFQQKTKAKDLEDVKGTTINYIEQCAHYIHRNPLQSNLVRNLKEWRFSSYPDYLGIRNDKLCSKEILYNAANLDKENFTQCCEDMAMSSI